jgi:hypothetical protein
METMMSPVMLRCRALRVSSVALAGALAWGLATSPAARAADDEPPPATAPPPSLAPEIPPAPPPKDQKGTEVEDAFKVPESPEPTATPAPEPTESAEKEQEAPKDEKQEEAAAPAPEPSATSEPTKESGSEARGALVVEAKREHGVPPYQLARPNWAFELSAAGNALGSSGFAPEQAGDPCRALQLQFEYQPSFIQSIGVLGIGLTGAIYPITVAGDLAPDTNVVNGVASVWSVGAEVRYQARFFREQPVVPVGGFEADWLHYHFTDSQAGSPVISGPFAGLMVLLNIFEPTVAAEAYITQGIARSYLVVEYKLLSGSDSLVSVSGGEFYAGFRLEF